MRRSDRPGASGFTLIEVVISVTLVGLLSAVLAAVFTTVVRTSPSTEERADDARSLLAITTWLPRDVGSASPTSFRAGDLPSSCSSGVDAGSQGLLELQWTAGGTTLVANYRFVTRPDGLGTIERYACALNGAATASRMTAPLRTIPVTATPQPSEAPAPVDISLYGTSGAYEGLRLEIVVLAEDGVTTRSLLALDAETSNVPTTLAPTTTVIATSTTTSTLAPNPPPIAADLFVQVHLDEVLAGFDLPATDAEPLTATIVAFDPELAVVVDPSGLGFSVEAQTAAGAVDGATYTFTYTVSDGTSTSNIGTVTVHAHDADTPGTTTTTSTTTTTTQPPCTASLTLAPSTVAVKNSGHLTNDVVATITSSGSCAPLVLSFDPDTTDTNTTPQQIAFNGGTTVTIGKNTYTWRQPDSPTWTFAIRLLEGANGDPEGTAEDSENLVVT
jgi:prepilin-type N-terminal cleavage/methylation domain-containing protein